MEFRFGRKSGGNDGLDLMVFVVLFLRNAEPDLRFVLFCWFRSLFVDFFLKENCWKSEIGYARTEYRESTQL